MKYGILILALFLPGLHSSLAQQRGIASAALTGNIADKEFGAPLPGVYVYIPDLKTGGITDDHGDYSIKNLPRVKIMVQLSYLGYKDIFTEIDLSAVSKMDFTMERAAIEMNEIIITGSSKSRELRNAPTPVSIVPRLSLVQGSSLNIIDAIASMPGISQVTTGPGISKPVIRGLGYNRIVVVNDGIRQEGQQWGDEHGIEIDEASVNKVEILKGPASLSYGSDALAGVINMISFPTLPEGEISGNIAGDYQSNNGLLAYSANLAGNTNGFVWDARYSAKMAHAYQNRFDGYVFNSGFRENAAGIMLGLNKRWGYSHLTLGLYDFTPGIIEGERDSLTGKFIKANYANDQFSGHTIAGESDFKSYDLFVPYQKVRHYKAVLNNNIIIGQGNLKTIFGFQQNHRQEFADAVNPDEYELFFLLNSIHYDIQYNLPEKNNLDMAVGLNGMRQTSENKGSEFLIPAYGLIDFGLFSTFEKDLEKIVISGGLRYDIRSVKGDGLYLDSNERVVASGSPGAVQKFREFDDVFSGVSGSLGLTWHFSEKLLTKFNISRGIRAPNIAELAANGLHEGTIRYEIGNTNLRREGSWQADLSAAYNSHHVSAEANLFFNRINNFIFLTSLNSAAGGDSITEGYPTFRFTSGDANLFGGEISVDIHPHPLDWIHFENAFSYVSAMQEGQPDSMKYLPFTPGPKFQSSLKTDIRKMGSVIGNAFIRIGLERFFAQNNIFSAYGTETATPGYTLVNFGLGTDLLVRKKTFCSLYFNINNLFDVAYQNHLSRLKYADINRVTGRIGVFDMGRNVSLKIIVPVSLKSS